MEEKWQRFCLSAQAIFVFCLKLFVFVPTEVDPGLLSFRRTFSFPKNSGSAQYWLELNRGSNVYANNFCFYFLWQTEWVTNDVGVSTACQGQRLGEEYILGVHFKNEIIRKWTKTPACENHSFWKVSLSFFCHIENN